MFGEGRAGAAVLLVGEQPGNEEDLAGRKPEIVVALGATAAQTLLGRSFRVTTGRGVVVESELHPRVVATVHPSSILRAPDADARRAAMESFVEDLRVVAKLLA